jgi:hypothetical protein
VAATATKSQAVELRGVALCGGGRGVAGEGSGGPRSGAAAAATKGIRGGAGGAAAAAAGRAALLVASAVAAAAAAAAAAVAAAVVAAEDEGPTAVPVANWGPCEGSRATQNVQPSRLLG